MRLLDSLTGTVTPELKRSGVSIEGFYAHSSLQPDHHHDRGRLLKVNEDVPDGTVLLVDLPYAIVPITNSSQTLLCSNLQCSRRVPGGSGVSCPHQCLEQVVWCKDNCRRIDRLRHDIECSWLKQFGKDLLQQEGQYDFATVWHVVRLIATRFSDQQKATKCKDYGKYSFGWEAADACCAYPDSWPAGQLARWKHLVDKYVEGKINSNTIGPRTLSSVEILSLMCKEETNTFGLYPKRTGPRAMMGGGRGECYGFGLYPRAAMMNHSCSPNVSHCPDERGRMVYTAARDIKQGEECFIAYFDLSVHEDVETRRKHCESQFRFICACEPCVVEDADRNRDGLDLLPFGLDG